MRRDPFIPRTCDKVGTALGFVMTFFSVVGLLTMNPVAWGITYVLLAATMYVVIFHIAKK